MSTFHWLSGFFCLAVFSWIALDMFTGWLPWNLIDTTDPGKKKLGVILLVVMGGGGLFFYQDFMYFVWLGIKHILLLDALEMVGP